MDNEIKLPEQWKNWEITEWIGEGSYGDVYRASYEDPSSGKIQEAAIKIIRIPSSRAEALELAVEIPDEEARARYYENTVEGLLSEIRAMEALRDVPNVVALQDYCKEYDIDEQQWSIFIRMELLTPFKTYITLNEMDEDEVIRLGVSMCDALEACAEHGILHRDIKPENIMVSSEGEFKLGDFGEARQMDLTSRSLSVKGTPAYMAPEVFRAETYDALADQYSLGIVLYRQLNHNREPFVDPEAKMIDRHDKDSAFQKRMHGDSFPMPAEASPELGKVILKACAYQKSDRYSTISDFRKALQSCGEGAAGSGADAPAEAAAAPAEAAAARPRKALAVAAAVVLAAALAVAFVLSGGLAGKASGTLGDNLAWAVSKGTLTISGEGPMAACNGDLQPWRKINSKIDAIVVEEGVTSLGTFAFDECANARSVVLPKSLTEIGGWAFSRCESLEQVDLPEDLVSIGEYAFKDCSSLKEIDIPDSVSEIGDRAFVNCAALQAIAIPKGIAAVPPSLCSGCRQMKEITIPDGVTEIGESAFYGCYEVAEIVLPGTITAISEGAFSNCGSLKKIVIPGSVTTIEGEIFSGYFGGYPVIYGEEGSAAEQYAETYGFPFMAMENGK